jgi:putative acetyltransferase
MIMKIVAGGLDNEQVLALLRFHFDTNIAVTPPGSAHVFDVSRLQQPDVFFWSAWMGEGLMGIGALKAMDADHGEIKSMHTVQSSRRSGVGGALLRHIMDEARMKGLKRLSLETGSFDYFAPARALYAKHGFKECAPYADYKLDPNSTFMTREI